MRFPDLGSHNLTTFSGEPEANRVPDGFTAKAYMEHLLEVLCNEPKLHQLHY